MPSDYYGNQIKATKDRLFLYKIPLPNHFHKKCLETYQHIFQLPYFLNLDLIINRHAVIHHVYLLFSRNQLNIIFLTYLRQINLEEYLFNLGNFLFIVKEIKNRLLLFYFPKIKKIKLLFFALTLFFRHGSDTYLITHFFQK